MSEDTAAARPQSEPVVEMLTAHLAGVEHEPSGAATLWLSDEATTMHFPLTPATVPALIAQLREVGADQAQVLRGPNGTAPVPVDDEPDVDVDGDPDDAAEGPVEERPSRFARWTGWHYSNSLVSRIPAQQRAALFAAVLVILLLITLLTRG